MNSFDYSILNERPFFFFFSKELWKIYINIYKRKSLLILERFEVFCFHSFFSMSKEKGRKKGHQGKGGKEGGGLKKKEYMIVKCEAFLLRSVCVFNLENMG